MKVKCTRHTVVVVVTLASHNCMWLAKSAVVVTGCDVALPVGGGLGTRRERIHPERRQRRIKIYVSQPPGLHARIVKCCRQVSLLIPFWRSLLCCAMETEAVAAAHAVRARAFEARISQHCTERSNSDAASSITKLEAQSAALSTH